VISTTGGGRSDGGAATLASARHEKGVWPSGTAYMGGGELGGALGGGDGGGGGNSITRDVDYSAGGDDGALGGGGDGGGGGNSIRGNVVAHVTCCEQSRCE
jgi:hypothetical protein